MKQIFILWIFLAASAVFGQDADLSIELEVRPSLTLATDQNGFLDVIVTNHGPSARAATFYLIHEPSEGFPNVRFGEHVSGQCGQSPIFDPPPPGHPWFGPNNTRVLAVGESEICTYAFQLYGTLPQNVVIQLKVMPKWSSSSDPDLSNNIASLTITFMDTRPVPLFGSIAIWILVGLILVFGAIKGRRNLT